MSRNKAINKSRLKADPDIEILSVMINMLKALVQKVNVFIKRVKFQ